ncbi:MAG: aromatic ring-hydroxylating dioxygenase subunit alpha [Pseudomonadota bacterium]|jgi:phenylpropionate dioxygenase-like ring-hydroxylating dioxygenase large terminal subunit|nr:aromatic ring-hydroxylating dioxygenase subunit alpha [Pseudomonadota bacterium]
MSDHLRIIDSWPEQKIGNHSIPGYRYTSREFFDKEWEGMWTKVWLLLGRASEIPNNGDWQMEPVGPEEILMVRQKEGGIKAFYNVCQHRGNPLVDTDKGSVLRRFVCKYHSWAYTPDGELNFAPDKEDFPEGNPCGKLRLQELACETFAGFIWINMNPACSSLREYLGPIWDDWHNRDIQSWTRTLANSMNLPCNWKVVLDNFNESYHVPTVHQGATPDTNRKKIRGNIDTYFKETQFDLSDEGHNRMVMKGGFGVGQMDQDGNVKEPLASQLRYWDLDPADFKGKPEATREALQQAKRALGPARGYSHYDKVPDEQLTDAFHYTLFPNFAVSVWADGFHFLRARPHRSDPEQCVFDNWWYSSPASVESAQPTGTLGTGTVADVEKKWLQFPEDSIGPGIEDDVSVFVTQQRGFRSRGFKGVYLSNQENRIRRLHELVDDYIEGRLPAN